MSADAPAKRDVSPTRAVGTARKAETPNGEASKRAKVSADDLARALGGTTPEPAPKPLAPAVPQGPDFGLKEVRARDAASARCSPPSFFKRPSRQISPDAPRAPGAPTSHPPSRPLSRPPTFHPRHRTHRATDSEVRWVISEADDDARPRPARETVGGGVASSPPPRVRCLPRGPGVWGSHYDAHPDAGFDAEVRAVRLTAPGLLEDPGEGAVLRWRREGCAGDGLDDSADFDAEDEEPADPNVVHVAEPVADAAGTVSVNEMLTAQREVDARKNGGRSLEEHGMDAFATMPMERQQKMASAFAGLKDGLSRAFAELQERNGPDYAITSEDIAEIMQKMRR